MRCLCFLLLLENSCCTLLCDGSLSPAKAILKKLEANQGENSSLNSVFARFYIVENNCLHGQKLIVCSYMLEMPTKGLHSNVKQLNEIFL